MTLLSRPKLGAIEVTNGRIRDNWYYQPTKFNKDGTYVGRDHFVVKVEYKGVTVFVHYYIEVVGNDPTTYIGDDRERHGHFCGLERWKISQAPDSSAADVSAWPRSAQLNTLIAKASTAYQGLQSLPGSSVDTTVGVKDRLFYKPA